MKKYNVGICLFVALNVSAQLSTNKTPDVAPLVPAELSTLSSIPTPPTSEPPSFPDGYILHPDPDGTLKLWELAGRLTLTNVPPPIKQFHIWPQVKTSNVWVQTKTGFTINCENESRFYQLRITRINDVCVIQPEYKTDLLQTEWEKDDMVFTLSATSTNWRMAIETEIKPFQ